MLSRETNRKTHADNGQGSGPSHQGGGKKLQLFDPVTKFLPCRKSTFQATGTKTWEPDGSHLTHDFIDNWYPYGATGLQLGGDPRRGKGSICLGLPNPSSSDDNLFDQRSFIV